MRSIVILLIIVAIIIWKKSEENDDNWINEAQRKNENRFNYLNQNIIHEKETERFTERRYDYRDPSTKPRPQRGKPKQKDEPGWYPTGWYYNEETQSWEPPDYIKKEATDKWRWDEERQIWIDKEKEERLKKYYAYRKSQGLPPTYEEWKSAKLAEERKKQEEHEDQHPEK